MSDPADYAHTTNDPARLLQSTLRDQLTEHGWRQIRVRREDDNEWVIEAGYIDPRHREHWLANGARVAPQPTESKDLRMKIVRLFSAAARRAGIVLIVTGLEYIKPVYDLYDLHTDYGDFEEDLGDWKVAIRFEWLPGDGFWSKNSQAIGYS